MESTLQSVRPITKENPYRICFVCLGNICRSPTGEGVMQHEVNQAGLSSYFEIDSAGTGAYHVGEKANSKSRKVAEEHGIKLHSTARKFEPSDLDYFDLVLAMDRQNFKDLKSMAKTDDHTAKIHLLRDFDSDPDDFEVPDPYYGGLNGFYDVFYTVQRSCKGLLEELKQHVTS